MNKLKLVVDNKTKPSSKVKSFMQRNKEEIQFSAFTLFLVALMLYLIGKMNG